MSIFRPSASIWTCFFSMSLPRWTRGLDTGLDVRRRHYYQAACTGVEEFADVPEVGSAHAGDHVSRRSSQRGARDAAEDQTRAERDRREYRYERADCEPDPEAGERALPGRLLDLLDDMDLPLVVLRDHGRVVRVDQIEILVDVADGLIVGARVILQAYWAATKVNVSRPIHPSHCGSKERLGTWTTHPPIGITASCYTRVAAKRKVHGSARPHRSPDVHLDRRRGCAG